ncbi:MAG TPA: 2-C-methyl-D-erythritol 4-phosphate cytidylyltransferase [Nitrospirae bacterium]|nr:2-C-methyl-D-erythritol 4-phosphate cytidylyltransferase [Nitrospirota bacterium]
MERVIAIVPAAGAGRRFGGNKVFATLGGLPVLGWVLKTLQSVEVISEIIPVLSGRDIEKGLGIVESLGIGKVHRIVPGGKERQDSVYRGISAIDGKDCLVLIHDGVRPLVSSGLVERVIMAVQGYDGAVAAVPVKDTIKVVDGETIIETPDRNSLVSVQTPQAFPYGVLCRAYQRIKAEGGFFTDDASIVEHYGGRVRVVEGEYRNIKITTPEDILMAERLLETRG